MARKPPLCRNCGLPMKGHPKSGCPIPNLRSVPEQKSDKISSIPSFVIPETGPFRRRNPNYVLPPSEVEPVVLSSASFTPTEPVCSVNAMKPSFPPFQQFTPNWSRPSSPQPTRRILKEQSSFVLEPAPVGLSPASVFGTQPKDSVRLVAGIYQVPTTTVETYRSRALSNGIYCVPIEPLKGDIPEELMHDLEPSTWFVTGPSFSDVDALVAILRPRGLFWRISQMQPIAIMQVVGDMDVLRYGVLTLLLLGVFRFVLKL